jgi:adenosylcobyric acid synthase
MVLGTASHVGKTITVAALCRSLNDRNITVAPFKSQNMSLNSFVTTDGSEIGIAQAMQAFAARLEPISDMNPVLLKPKGDQTSQVVLHGKPYCDVHIGDYYKKTGYLLNEVTAAFWRLEDKYGNVVVEGAGGAAELNLYDRDIANILLAKTLEIPIIIVADIERGGVFAQIYGTFKLLPEDVRNHVVGVIINKFRGDPALFDGGVKKIEDLVGVPVLGVVPYTDLPLPSEDSLSIADKKSVKAPVRIGIVRVPRISNFTDFELLECNAAVHYVPLGEPLEQFDCIILPGTKNSVEDLESLWKSGTADEIIKARERGVPIIGICGGFQMLGKEIIDSGIESGTGQYKGLGLLNGITRFHTYEKTTIQVQRKASVVPPILSRIGEVIGYEIHMGETEVLHDLPSFGEDGAVSADGLVIGTYLHGLFQNPSAVNGLLYYLYRKKGLEYNNRNVPTNDTIEELSVGSENSYDKLARHFEEYVDIDFIASYFSKE